jgi:hypothetical protein
MSFTYAPIGDPGRRSVYFQAVSATGSRLGDNVLVSDRAASEYSDLAWSGKGFGTIWLDVSSTFGVADLRFTATDSLGAPTGPSVPLVAGVAIDPRWNPRIVWDEDHFAVSWVEPGPVSPTAFCLNVEVGRFTTAGAPIGAVVSPGCVSTPDYDVLWTGSGYVFAIADQFSPESTFRIVRVGLDGVTSERTLPAPNANAPHLRLDGSELVLSWVDHGTLMTQRLDTGGAPLDAATTVFATGDQRLGLLSTSGTDFLVVGAAVHRIGVTGTNETVALPGSRYPVRLTFSGGQYVALIARTMNGNPQDVEFVRIGDCDATKESGLGTPLGCLSPAPGGGASDFACGPTVRCQSRKEFCIIPSFDSPSCRPMPRDAHRVAVGWANTTFRGGVRFQGLSASSSGARKTHSAT